MECWWVLVWGFKKRLGSPRPRASGSKQPSPDFQICGVYSYRGVPNPLKGNKAPHHKNPSSISSNTTSDIPQPYHSCQTSTHSRRAQLQATRLIWLHTQQRPLPCIPILNLSQKTTTTPPTGHTVLNPHKTSGQHSKPCSTELKS